MLIKLNRRKAPREEVRYYIELSAALTPEQEERLHWLLAETFEPDGLGFDFLQDCPDVIEVGPNLRFTTPWSTTAMDIFRQCGLDQIIRVEHTRRIGFSRQLPTDERDMRVALLFDRMTEAVYPTNFTGFPPPATPVPVEIVPVLTEGLSALTRVNREFGLAMEPQDLEFCLWLFAKHLKRNPTIVELFQLGQANSEHCRHKRLRGIFTIDGVEQPHSMWQIIKDIYAANKGNSVLGLCDNSSAIYGYPISAILPINPGRASLLHKVRCLTHWILTVETHNFPTGIAPYPGAATGVGGMLRDLLGTGTAADMLMVGAGYIVDHLHIPDYELPWEMDGWTNPPDLAAALEILNQASLGASDYGNCIGTPLTFGYRRSHALTLPDGRRVGKYKPTMMAHGVGRVNDEHLLKGDPEVGLLALQLGGPALRVGLGGGAASSMNQGDNIAELDFNAVQRGDAYMEQLVWRVIRACIELGRDNPIVLIHDLGAGGSLNALTEALLPKGGRIDLRKLPVGDLSLSAMEIWGNEAQERMAILIHPDDLERFMEICAREGAPCAVVGEVTGSGWIELYDSEDDSYPVRLPLKEILEQLPRQKFSDDSVPMKLESMVIPDLSFAKLLDRVLHHPNVCSTRFLIEIADSSVGGLVIKQQTDGPAGLPVSDYAISAGGFDDPYGVAVAIGEQPLSGLISPAALPRLGIAECALNMVGAGITKFEDTKFSVNWCWPAREPGEAARIFAAILSMESFMYQLRVALDGGKDSFSMVVRNVEGPDGQKHTVCSPGELVFTGYAPVDDVELHINQYLRLGDALIHLPATSLRRLGGSTFGLTFGQLGDECPDIDDVAKFANLLTTLIRLVKEQKFTAIHDISDGGLIITALEMAFAGNTGLEIDLTKIGTYDAAHCFFAQEPGVVVACPDDKRSELIAELVEAGVEYQLIGWAHDEDHVVVAYDGQLLIDTTMTDLRDAWEETSFMLAKQRINPKCVEDERNAIEHLLTPPPYCLTFTPVATPNLSEITDLPIVAVVRAPGSNGDMEAKAALMAAGFNVSDVNMNDLIEGRATLSAYQGLFFPGGFSFADVLDSGKGWAGMVRFQEDLNIQFRDFYQRRDTFSIGVCNGCQFMALLGWVPGASNAFTQYTNEQQPRFIHNPCGRFRRSWVTVQVNESPSILFKDMAGSRLGIWVAHGEGRLHFPDNNIFDLVQESQLAPLSYVGPDGQPTEDYPFNPNGSPLGITSLCSPDGRHTAMMPHPERVFQKRQWPWMPDDWKRDLEESPWLRMFQNAFEWCMEHRS